MQHNRFKVLPDNVALLMIHTGIVLYRIPHFATVTNLESLPWTGPDTLWHYDNTLHHDGSRFSRSIRLMHQWDGLPPAEGVSCMLCVPTTKYFYTITIPVPGRTSYEPSVTKVSLNRSSLYAGSFRRFRGTWAEQQDGRSGPSPTMVRIFGKRGPQVLESREVHPQAHLQEAAGVMLDEISGRLGILTRRRNGHVHIWDFI